MSTYHFHAYITSKSLRALNNSDEKPLPNPVDIDTEDNADFDGGNDTSSSVSVGQLVNSHGTQSSSHDAATAFDRSRLSRDTALADNAEVSREASSSHSTQMLSGSPGPSIIDTDNGSLPASDAASSYCSGFGSKF